MPLTNDKNEALPRLTRSKLRLNSESDANDLESNRSDTPTRNLRMKKIEINDSAPSTPSKRTTRASSVTRNLLEEQVIASPLRRTTRRMSSEQREVTASPLRATTRTTRRSTQNLNESDDDSVIFVSEQQATPRTKTSRAKDLIKLEEVAEEESENVPLNTSNENELELRNRSINRTPPFIVLTRISASNISNPKSLQEEMDKAAVPGSDNENMLQEEKGEQMQSDVTTQQSDDVTMDIDDQLDSRTADNTEIIIETDKMIDYQVSQITKDLIDGNDEPATEDNRSVEEILISPRKTGSPKKMPVSCSPSKKKKTLLSDINTSPSIKSAAMDLEDFESSSKPHQKSPSIKGTPSKTPETSSESAIQALQKSPEKSASWNTSIINESNPSIDAIKIATDELQVISAPPVLTRKIISSDESDAESATNEKNSFVIDEAEAENSYSEGESMTKSERDEMEQNEVQEDGESLGSQNTDEMTEEDEEESNSFIADDENIDDQYSMDSDEENIENEIESPKRASRIIRPLSDSDSEKETAKPQSDNANAILDIEKLFNCSGSKKINSRQTLPAQSGADVSSQSFRKSLPTKRATGLLSSAENSDSEKEIIDSNKQNEDAEMSEESLIDEPINNRKRKRVSVVHQEASPKRFKEMTPNESEALHMENIEESVEKDIVSKPEKKKKAQDVSVNIPKLLDRCEEYLEQCNQSKKEKKALKRQKKEEKLLKKKQDDHESFDSNENKENSKKKKKNKAKKQKLVAEMEPEKDDLASKISKRNEKLELKRERKKKKKEMKAVLKTDQAAMEIDNVAPIAVKQKKKKTALDNDMTATQRAEEEANKKMEKTSNDQKPMKKSKQFIEEQLTTKEEESKGKKRRIDELNVSNNDAIEKPKAKKKLNILQQVTEPHQKSTQKRDSEQDTMMTITSKIMKVIPKGMEKGSKQIKKKKMHSKKIAEPQLTYPRPVWTSAGTFIEEPVKPFKFTTTVYKPIKVAGAAMGRVIPFEAKAKKQPMMSQSSKEQTLMVRNKKSRDNTMKNIKNLI